MAPERQIGAFSMAYYEVDNEGTIRIYEYTPDRSTFSGYSSVLSEKITFDELKEIFKKNGLKLSVEKM